MFSDSPMDRDAHCSYVPIPSSRDLFVHLIYHPRQDVADSDLSLKDLLNGVHQKNAASMFIFEAAGHGSFLLWTTRCDTTSTNSLDDALEKSQDFIEKSSTEQMCLLFNSKQEELGMMPDRSSSPILAVFARCNAELPSFLGMPLSQQEKLAQANQHTREVGLRRSFLRSTSVLISNRLPSCQILFVSVISTCVLVILLLLVKNQMVDHAPDKYHTWMAYDTHGSIGPKYQLSLTGQNASAWTSYIQDDGEWTLRIDDQAIVPLALMDEEDIYYQEWYQNRYPEINQIRLNHDYLNETWLRSPSADQVPADDLFHFSHCVLALKRYIKAKETGRHVCGRDIDHEHMKHCLDALDWWAFPDKRTETYPNPQVTFYWKTKVCFD